MVGIEDIKGEIMEMTESNMEVIKVIAWVVTVGIWFGVGFSLARLRYMRTMVSRVQFDEAMAGWDKANELNKNVIAKSAEALKLANDWENLYNEMKNLYYGEREIKEYES